MSLQGDFQDIEIKDKFDAKPDKNINNIYYLPILFSADLPKEWVALMKKHYESHQHNMDEKLLHGDDIEFPITYLPHDIRKASILQSILFFRYSMTGGGPHPNTVESLTNACKKANVDYRRLLAETEKREEYEEKKRAADLSEQQRKDQKAVDVTKDWFK